MKDIELRWLTRDYMEDTTIKTETILQYRKRQYLVNYSAILPTGEYTNEPVWMEWVDVPTHTKHY